MTEKNYYTINELAAEINRNRKTVWHWIRLGKLRSHRCGVEHRILKTDWEEALAKFNEPRERQAHA